MAPNTYSLRLYVQCFAHGLSDFFNTQRLLDVGDDTLVQELLTTFLQRVAGDHNHFASGCFSRIFVYKVAPPMTGITMSLTTSST